ncbi:MAG TPA: DNA-formamidopyrimidine glycosylase family protein [Enhygromyxa sp.]|nr:DNA-formamidopyrimidine glycosylase family protein [Enhygromyxa sp.]
MPEGDTIHKVALRLRPLFVGQRLLEIECELAAVDDWLLPGREVARIEARGKNLLIHCAPLELVEGKPDPRKPEQLPVAIWTHLGMDGAWRLRTRDVAAAGRPPAIALHVASHVAACYEPKQLAVLGPRSLLRHPMLAQLGPDLLDPEADLDEAVSRLRALGRAEIGDAIMRQSAVAGIGNVYKSELLFLERLSPFLGVHELEPARLRTVLERARALMQANVDARGPRRTRLDREAPRQRLWVYERSGRPCYVCSTILEMRRQGELARSTYYCPQCQPRTRAST